MIAHFDTSLDFGDLPPPPSLTGKITSMRTMNHLSRAFQSLRCSVLVLVVDVINVQTKHAVSTASLAAAVVRLVLGCNGHFQLVWYVLVMAFLLSYVAGVKLSDEVSLTRRTSGTEARKPLLTD